MLITQITIWDELESEIIATITQNRDDNGENWDLEIIQPTLSHDDVKKIAKAYEMIDDYLNKDGNFEFIEKGLMI